jgi:hypothetical protein
MGGKEGREEKGGKEGREEGRPIVYYLSFKKDLQCTV